MKKTLIVFSLITCLVACNTNGSHQFGKMVKHSITLFANTAHDLAFFVSVDKKRKMPETVVGDFVLRLAEGNCDEAIKLITGRAVELVQSSIDAGCEKYETIILGVQCVLNEEDKNKMKCNCQEDRAGLEMDFGYELVKIKKDWKVEYYEKELNMEEISD